MAGCEAMAPNVYFASGPIFSVACLGESPSSAPSMPCYRVIYAGGGGSGNTGVGNGIIAVDLNEGGSEELCRLDTGVNLCTCICVGRESSLLVAVFGNKFRLCRLNGLGGRSLSPKEIKVVSENHISDFKDIDPSINCCAFDCNFDDFLAIGGDDGVLRIWTIPLECEDRISCKLVRACTPGHTSPITDCSFSDSGHLVATASKDGTCQVWSVGTGDVICFVSVANSMPPRRTRSKFDHRLIVRACKFVGDDCLVSIQSAPRGHAFATRWALDVSNGDELTVLRATPSVNRRISKYPVSAVFLEQEIIAHGNVEGFIAFLSAKNLAPLGNILQLHDLPVTALVVVSQATNQARLRSLSVSADYKIVIASLISTPRRLSIIHICALITLGAPFLFVFSGKYFIISRQ